MLLDAGDAAQAAGVFRQALEEEPGNPRLLLYLGLADVEEGECDRGLDQIRQALEAEPRNMVLQMFHARALYDTGAFAEATESCRRVQGIQPDHMGASALIHLCEADQEPTAALGRLAMEDLPDDPQIAGRALDLAERSLLSIESRDSTPRWRQGSSPWDLPGKVPAPDPDAGPALAAGNGRVPGLPGKAPDYKGWLRKARFFQVNEAPQRAIVFAEAVMRTHPSDEIRVLLADLYFGTGMYAEAEAALRDFLPNDPERNSFVGASLYHLGDLPGALAALKKVESKSGAATHALGKTYLALGQDRDARRAFILTAKLDETIPPDRIAYAYLRSKANAGTDLGEVQRQAQTEDG